MFGWFFYSINFSNLKWTNNGVSIHFQNNANTEYKSCGGEKEKQAFWSIRLKNPRGQSEKIFRYFVKIIWKQVKTKWEILTPSRPYKIRKLQSQIQSCSLAYAKKRYLPIFQWVFYTIVG